MGRKLQYDVGTNMNSEFFPIAPRHSNNSDDLDEDCFEGISKPPLDLQIPLQANAHLYCHASNLQLDYEENNPFDQKTQK